MKLKSIFAAVLAVIVFAACTNEDGGNAGKGETKSVKLRITQQSLSRAEADKVDGTTTVALGDGYLYFATATTVTKVMTISAAATDASNVSNAELTSATGATINNVPDNSTQVIIVSNLPTSVSPSAMMGSPVSDIQDLDINVVDLNDAAGDVAEVPLYGVGDIVLNVTPATAEVEVAPISSRIEVGGLSLKEGSQITSYKVTGIFINNYYTDQTISGGSDVANIVNNGSDQAKYGFNTTEYPDGFPLYNWFDPALESASGAIAPATAGKVWAYNVFPAINDPITEDNLPHIIIALEDVTVGTEVLTEKYYLTLATYKTVSDATMVSEFKKAYVYNISSVLFDENDLGLQPEANTIDVNVLVNLVTWTPEAIEWTN